MVAPAAPGGTPDSIETQRPWYNWVMHCQGCHGGNAQGTPGGAPTLASAVARFLQVADGRRYLARVPGVSFVDLPDADVAELLNWVVWQFDPSHVPKDFKPYTAEEIRILRRSALISNAGIERNRILQLIARCNTSRSSAQCIK